MQTITEKNKLLQDLQPAKVWSYFIQISQIPRATYQEEEVLNFLKKFASQKGLVYFQDEVGNIIIQKPAQNSSSQKTIILQGHVDMVTLKNDNYEFDFDTQGIELRLFSDKQNNQFVSSKQTTLGADNGVGLAMILAVLDDSDISHPALQAIFTVAEEVGMDGVLGLDTKNIDKADYLLNLDSEESDCLTISSAASVDVEAELQLKKINFLAPKQIYQVSLEGLYGGHSGVDINKQRLNASLALAEFLLDLYLEIGGFGVVEFQAGQRRNAIPISARSVVACGREIDSKKSQKLTQAFLARYKKLEANLKLNIQKIKPKPKSGFSNQDTLKFLKWLKYLPDGVQKMSLQIPSMVHSSANLGLVETTTKGLKTTSLLRINDTQELQTWLLRYLGYFQLWDSKLRLDTSLQGYSEKLFKTEKLTISTSQISTGWTEDKDSELVKLYAKAYQEILKKETKIAGIHAGLECGILKSVLGSQIQAISFGPDILDAHTPSEKVEVKSVEKIYKVLLKLLSFL